jgi:hypothetical protein
MRMSFSALDVRRHHRDRSDYARSVRVQCVVRPTFICLLLLLPVQRSRHVLPAPAVLLPHRSAVADVRRERARFVLRSGRRHSGTACATEHCAPHESWMSQLLRNIRKTVLSWRVLRINTLLSRSLLILCGAFIDLVHPFSNPLSFN